MDILMDVSLPLFATNGRQELGAPLIPFYPVSLERSSAAPDPCPTLSLLCFAAPPMGLQPPAITEARGRLPTHYSTAGSACQSAPDFVSNTRSITQDRLRVRGRQSTVPAWQSRTVPLCQHVL